jgi:hypothetical protein
MLVANRSPVLLHFGKSTQSDRSKLRKRMLEVRYELAGFSPLLSTPPGSHPRSIHDCHARNDLAYKYPPDYPSYEARKYTATATFVSGKSLQLLKLNSDSKLSRRRCVQTSQHYNELRKIQEGDRALPRSNDSRGAMVSERCSTSVQWQPVKEHRGALQALPRYPACFFVPLESFHMGQKNVGYWFFCRHQSVNLCEHVSKQFIRELCQVVYLKWSIQGRASTLQTGPYYGRPRTRRVDIPSAHPRHEWYCHLILRKCVLHWASIPQTIPHRHDL